MNAIESEAFLSRHPEIDDFELDDFHAIEAADFAREKTAIEKAQAKRREMKAAGVAVKFLTPLEKLATNPLSLRFAITAMCFECMGKAAGWRADVRDCTAPGCPLFQVRPGREKLHKNA
jgi:hypothetical protein